MILLKQMLILLVLMAIGFFLGKKNIFKADTNKSISWLIVNVANPALIISGSIGNSIGHKELIFMLAIAFGLFFAVILLAEVLIPLFRFERGDANVYKVLLAFSNMAFMGFPIISAMYGSSSLVYASIFLLPFNLLIYTYGIFRMSGSMNSPIEALKKCLNTGVISVLITLAISFWSLPIPPMLCQLINMLAGLTAPLAMLVIGASFVEMSFKELFLDVKMLVFSAFRLILVPLAGMLILRLVTSDVVIQGICFIVLATPCASMTAMLAQQYGGNAGLASKGIGVTTVISVITMPLLFLLLGLE